MTALVTCVYLCPTYVTAQEIARLEKTKKIVLVLIHAACVITERLVATQVTSLKYRPQLDLLIYPMGNLIHNGFVRPNDMRLKP